MNNKPQIEKALPAKKTLSHIIKPKHNIEQARAHLLGVCLLDSSYVYYLPATIHFTEYGAFTLAMIKQGTGLEAIIRHLQAVG